MKKQAEAFRRMAWVPVINVAGNFTALFFASIYFAVIAPGIQDGDTDKLVSRLIFMLATPVVIAPFVVPINMSLVLPLRRRLKAVFSAHMDDEEPSEAFDSELKELASQMVDLPLKLGGTTFLAWGIAGLLLGLGPFLWQGLFPWDAAQTKRMFVAVLFVGAPITVIFVYFALEWWLRQTLRECFPPRILRSVPGSIRVGTLPKLLVVSLLLGILPVGITGSLTLIRSHEINIDGRLNDFVSNIHWEILFLLCLWAAVAVSLSVFLAKSVSRPLKDVRDAMKRMESGDLDVEVPVVCNDDIGSVGEGFNRLAEGLKERDEIRETFGMYVSPEIAREALRSRHGLNLGGELREISILVSDLRGFTSMTDTNEPAMALQTLNRYLAAMTPIIVEYGGTIDEFTGDGILVFFGAPQDLPDHARAALSCAFAMQRAMEKLNKENAGIGLPRLDMGIAINCGELIVGHIGSDERKKYGAIGTPINMAFRVEALAGPGEILVTDAVVDKLEGAVSAHESRQVELKGIQGPVTVYKVAGLETPESS